MSLFHGRTPCHCPCPFALVRLHRELRHSTTLRSWVAKGQLTGVSSLLQTGFQTPSQQKSSSASSQGDKEDLKTCQRSVLGLHSLCCAQERSKYSPKQSFLSPRSTNPSQPPSLPSIPGLPQCCCLTSVPMEGQSGVRLGQGHAAPENQGRPEGAASHSQQLLESSPGSRA